QHPSAVGAGLNVCGRDQEKEEETRHHVERLSQLLRAERLNCREQAETIVSLRRLLDEHERRVHHMDSFSEGTTLRTGTAQFTRASPTQKLLDQVNRLQKQKTDLLVQ
ncbi:hypothetical protein EGW08_000271, partial [Elysia chlorotica]